MRLYHLISSSVISLNNPASFLLTAEVSETLDRVRDLSRITLVKNSAKNGHLYHKGILLIYEVSIFLHALQ